jgi:GNAT superfamily N-acetyltransferase
MLFTISLLSPVDELSGVMKAGFVMRTQARLRPAGPRDEQLLTTLLAGLSAASAFHRFMAGLGAPKPALVRALLREDADRGAWLALERLPDGTDRAVGHACWSVDARGIADLGVVVADGAQGRGIGGALFEAAARSAAVAGALGVHLDVHAENRRVLAILRARFGPGVPRWDQGLITVDVPIGAVVRAPVAVA